MKVTRILRSDGLNAGKFAELQKQAELLGLSDPRLGSAMAPSRALASATVRFVTSG